MGRRAGRVPFRRRARNERGLSSQTAFDLVLDSGHGQRKCSANLGQSRGSIPRVSPPAIGSRKSDQDGQRHCRARPILRKTGASTKGTIASGHYATADMIEPIYLNHGGIRAASRQSTSFPASRLASYRFLPTSNLICLAAPSVLAVASIFRHL